MLSLIRYRQNETSIFGNLYLNGAFVCFTLENKREAIPGGIYKVENSQSPKFGRELPLLYNDEVPAKRGIRIHVGNSPQDAKGCVLVGMAVQNGLLKESKAAENMVTMMCRNQTQLVISEI